MAVPADTFANFSCEGHDCREYLGVLTSGNERMTSTDNMSLPEWLCANARLAALAVASSGLVLSGTASAAEPPVTVEYQSAIAGYRHFDAQAPAVDWREANDAIRGGAEGDAHGMHDMLTPMAVPPAAGDTPPPATPDKLQAHPK
jgi:hypothetical protein